MLLQGYHLLASATPPTRQNILLTNDLTDKVVDEAISLNTHLIIAYHPILFKGIKRLVEEDRVQRVLLKCAAQGITIYR